jgi:TonB family protein
VLCFVRATTANTAYLQSLHFASRNILVTFKKYSCRKYSVRQDATDKYASTLPEIFGNKNLRNMKHILILLLCWTSSFGQDSINYKNETINRIDSNGNQTGVWKMFDESNNVTITCEFESGKLINKTNFYKDSKLIASFDNANTLEIFKNNTIIIAHYFRKENGGQTLVDKNGEELDSETIKLYASAAQVNPMFYGGTGEFFKYIGNSFKRNGEKGTVKIKFIIEPNGFTKNIEIIESSNPKLNDEAVRVITNSPRWQPAHQGGTFVNYPFSVPININ